MLGRVEDFFKIKFLKAMVLPVLVSHTFYFRKPMVLAIYMLKAPLSFFSLTIKFCVDSKNEITADFYFTPKSFLNLPHVG